VKIPVKKYEPNEEALRDINTVLREEYDEREPILRISREYGRLLLHHEEETKFLIEKIAKLEAEKYECNDVPVFEPPHAVLCQCKGCPGVLKSAGRNAHGTLTFLECSVCRCCYHADDLDKS
jgi:hypothetical protein